MQRNEYVMLQMRQKQRGLRANYENAFLHIVLEIFQWRKMYGLESYVESMGASIAFIVLALPYIVKP